MQPLVDRAVPIPVWVHDATGTLLIAGVWLACAAVGGMLSRFVDGERGPLDSTLVLLTLGYPVVVTQSVRGWVAIPLIIIGMAAAAAAYRWYRWGSDAGGRYPTTPRRRVDQ